MKQCERYFHLVRFHETLVIAVIHCHLVQFYETSVIAVRYCHEVLFYVTSVIAVSYCHKVQFYLTSVIAVSYCHLVQFFGMISIHPLNWISVLSLLSWSPCWYHVLVQMNRCLLYKWGIMSVSCAQKSSVLQH